MTSPSSAADPGEVALARLVALLTSSPIVLHVPDRIAHRTRRKTHRGNKRTTRR